MTDPTALLGDWIAGRPADWSSRAETVAIHAFADTVACILAGHREPVVTKLLATLRPMGDGPACAPGASGGLPAPAAALVNGTAAHALDYDDILDPSMSHPSAALVPALLALADARGGLAGARLTDAWLVGLDVLARLGEAFNLTHYFLGWHTTLSLGAPAVAAACARLLRLDATQCAHAVALATSMSGGSKRQFGTMAKPVHAGLAAQNGMMAALMAEAGIDAAPEIFDGRWGLLEMTATPGAGLDPPAGFAGLARRLAGPPAAEEYGIWIKAYPSCGSTHRPIAAAIALFEAGGWAPDELARIDLLVSPTAIGNLPFLAPKTAAEAKFCLPHCVALALTEGQVGLAGFAPETLARADLRALLPKCAVLPDPELTGQALGAALFERGTVVLTLRSGRELRADCVSPPGHPSRPIGARALREKFADCARAAGLSPSSGMALWQEVLTLGSHGRNPLRGVA